jgi:hypothetical protein
MVTDAVHPAASLAVRRPTVARALVLGTLAVGVLDISHAILVWALRGVPPIRVFQGVAAGLLGREAARGGGMATALLGAALHFFIAFCVVATYYLASRRWSLLRRRAVACGLAYGVGVYLFMQLVVLPLSATSGGGLSAEPARLLNGVLGHMFLVGLPAALATRRAASAD